MRVFAFAAYFVSSVVVAATGSAPPAARAEEAYFVCASSRSLHGGIFGKGPIRRYGPRPGTCTTSEWKRVGREEFKATATQWHGVDWAKEIPFFAELRPAQMEK